MTATTWFIIITLIIIIDYIFDWVISWLNINYKHQFNLHPFLKPYYDNDTSIKTRKYQRENFHVDKAYSTIALLVTLIALYTGILGKLFDYLLFKTNHLILSNLLLLLIIAAGSEIISIPFEIYSTFVIDQKYGFNKSTFKLFFLIKLKAMYYSA